LFPVSIVAWLEQAIFASIVFLSEHNVAAMHS